jgi:hypothetical protein
MLMLCTKVACVFGVKKKFLFGKKNETLRGVCILNVNLVGCVKKSLISRHTYFPSHFLLVIIPVGRVCWGLCEKEKVVNK